MELVFNYLTPPIFLNNNRIYAKLPQAHVICLRNNSFKMIACGNIGFIAIRFRAGAFRHFCNLPLGELVDSFQGIENIWGKSGLEVCNKVLQCKDLKERIETIETFLIKCYTFNKKLDQAAMDFAVNIIYYQYKDVNLQQLARTMNLSNRHFQRAFRQIMGVSPKFFQRISRFQTTIKYLMLNKIDHYLDIALANGYYDQSHFIKDFQLFIGERPTVFLTNKNFMAHFYNRSKHF